jgi:raffinose/stachyose/melibiose transport system substrate-binding protein
MTKLVSALGRWFPVLVLLVGLLGSSICILRQRTAAYPPGAIVIRLAHWQLEGGVRDAIDQAARDYRQEVNPNVYIVQEAIPETTYFQWLSTQFIGGNPADMIEISQGMLPYPLQLSYYSHYFEPLTPYAGESNPYNKQTDLASVPWRQTFADGNKDGYVAEMQEYMTVPLSQWGTRLFYNKTLLKKLTGVETPPQDFRNFVELCKRIQQCRTSDGTPYVPIACSKYHLPWVGRALDPITYPAVELIDFDRTDGAQTDDMFVAFRTGRIDFHFGAFKARYEAMAELIPFFQPGYNGVGRDEAVFIFAQQRALFIPTGTWDAGSLALQAKSEGFEVGLMPYPFPTPDDPRYGKWVYGPSFDLPGAGFMFGLTRNSKHPKEVVDFLMFATSIRENEKLNRIMNWLPSVREAEPGGLMKQFVSPGYGVQNGLEPTIGGQTTLKWSQLNDSFFAGRMTYDQLADEYAPFYARQGEADFEEQERDWRRALITDEANAAELRAALLFGSADDQAMSGFRYRTFVSTRQIFPELDHAKKLLKLKNGPELAASGPYQYSAAAMQRIEREVRQLPKPGSVSQ